MKKIVLISVLFVCAMDGFSASESESPRIVSLSPSLTELIAHLGKSECLVGRSSACDYPPSVKTIPIVGKFGVPFVEKMLAVRPDIVLTNSLKDQNVKKNVESMGIDFLIIPTDSFADYFRAVETLGEILSCRTAAAKEVSMTKRKLEELKKRNAALPLEKRPKVFMEIWHNPLMTVGQDSFIDDLITYAGGVNIASSEKKGYFKCSTEWVIMKKPDVIVCPSMKKGRISDILNRTGWAMVPAIKNRRVYVDLNEDFIYRLGPRTLEGIDELRKCFIGNE